MSLWRRWRAPDPLAGTLDPVHPPPTPDGEVPEVEPVESVEPLQPDRPSRWHRFAAALGDLRRRVVPLPDEVVHEFLGHGERVIHSDHPSFRSFVVDNTLTFLGLLVVATLLVGATFNGPTAVSVLLLIGLALVLLVLVFKRLGDRYTSYVVTDSRIMQITGVVSRKAHSIPWVRVTDLSVDQTLMGRLLGYATLHIESANEDSGLRHLDGVSDPMQFNQYVIDMVVAKQGTTQPAWVAAGEPGPPSMGRGLRRVRMSRRRRREEQATALERPPGSSGEPQPERARAAGARTVRRSPGTPAAPGGAPPGGREDRSGGDGAEVEEIDAETLAAQLRSTSSHSGLSGLRWADDQPS